MGAHSRTLEKDANRYGIFKMGHRPGGSNGRSRVIPSWEIACSSCGLRFKKAWGSGISPDGMVKDLKRAGWRVSLGSKPLCATCAHARPSPFAIPMVASARVLAAVLEDPDAIAPDANAILKYVEEANMTDPSPRVLRPIFALLDEHFDEPSHRYREGWSDEKIAKEVGTTRDLVVKMRRESYGELADDPRIAALREEIELLRTELGTRLIDFQEWERKAVQRLDTFERRLLEMGAKR